MMNMGSGTGSRRVVFLACVAVAPIVVGLTVANARTNEDPSTDRIVSAGLSKGTSPEEMPAVMVAKAKTALASNVQPGEVKVFAGDAQYKPVPARSLDKATYMYADLGDIKKHSWRLYVARVSDSVIGDPNKVRSCEHTLATGTALTCEIGVGSDGTRTLSVVTATVYDDTLENYTLVDHRTITEEQMPNVRLERYVEVTHPDGSETSVSETVLAPTSLTLDQFATSVDDATTLAMDPALQLAAS